MMEVNTMDIAVQLMLAVSLAACAGLRACLPIFIIGILSHNGTVTLQPSFAFLGHTDVLIIFGIASALEVMGDKIIAVDHFLDAVGTIARPAAGALLASAMLTHVDPAVGLMLGLIVGGGTALTVHTGKALMRAQSTALAATHFGLGNAGLSFAEDGMTLGGVWLAVHSPVVAFIVVTACIVGGVFMVRSTVRKAVFARDFLLSALRGRTRGNGGKQ
ncbi:MAG: DUF4126 domain-containing protein [Capsulimonadaceae bacterium]